MFKRLFWINLLLGLFPCIMHIITPEIGCAYGYYAGLAHFIFGIVAGCFMMKAYFMGENGS